MQMPIFVMLRIMGWILNAGRLFAVFRSVNLKMGAKANIAGTASVFSLKCRMTRIEPLRSTFRLTSWPGMIRVDSTSRLPQF